MQAGSDQRFRPVRTRYIAIYSDSGLSRYIAIQACQDRERERERSCVYWKPTGAAAERASRIKPKRRQMPCGGTDYTAPTTQRHAAVKHVFMGNQREQLQKEPATSNRSDDRCHAAASNRSDDRCHAVGFTAPTTQRSALVDASAADLAERHGLVNGRKPKR